MLQGPVLGITPLIMGLGSTTQRDGSPNPHPRLTNKAPNFFSSLPLLIMIPDFDKSLVYFFPDMRLVILVTRTNHDCIAFWAHLGIIWLLFLTLSHFGFA